MTSITFQDGKVVMRDGLVGTEQECCCGGVGCEDCPLTCCLTIEGRNTCEGGTAIIATDPDLIVVNWGQTENSSTWEYLSPERDIFIDVTIEPCTDGVIALDVILNEGLPGGPSPTTSSTRRWANARAILGDDGCPVGVALGELTESEGPDPSITPTLGWICT